MYKRKYDKLPLTIIHRNVCLKVLYIIYTSTTKRLTDNANLQCWRVDNSVQLSRTEVRRRVSKKYRATYIFGHLLEIENNQ